MELNFGKWVVNESGIYLERNRGNFHTINKKELWKVSEYNGVLVWDWFIHFSGQCWFDRTNLNDFVVAFAFAQDYLKQYKPENAKMASIAQSIYIAQQMISIDADLEDSKDNEIGTKISDGLLEILKADSEIKILKMPIE